MRFKFLVLFCILFSLFVSVLTLSAEPNTAAKNEATVCKVPHCQALASVVSQCTCGIQSYKRTLPKAEAKPVYCCKDPQTGKFNLQSTPCSETVRRQKRMAKIFCPVDQLWGTSGIVVKYGLTPDIILVVHPALIPALDSIRESLQLFSGVFRKNESVGFNPRSLAGYNGEKPLYSLHAFGLAIDFNWSTNPYCPVFPNVGACDACETALESDLPDDLIRLLESAGFEWGGRWEIPDPMHFELREENWPKVACAHWKKRVGSRKRWLD